MGFRDQKMSFFRRVKTKFWGFENLETPTHPPYMAGNGRAPGGGRPAGGRAGARASVDWIDKYIEVYKNMDFY